MNFESSYNITNTRLLITFQELRGELLSYVLPSLVVSNWDLDSLREPTDILLGYLSKPMNLLRLNIFKIKKHIYESFNDLCLLECIYVSHHSLGKILY